MVKNSDIIGTGMHWRKISQIIHIKRVVRNQKQNEPQGETAAHQRETDKPTTLSRIDFGCQHHAVFRSIVSGHVQVEGYDMRTGQTKVTGKKCQEVKGCL